MSSILEQFANGDVPKERPFNHNPEYKQALSNFVAAREKLLAILSDEGKAIFEEFLDAQSEVTYLDDIENFIHSFSLGVRMTAEVFIAQP